MKKSINLFLLITVFLFGGCDDFFESTVALDPPEAENVMYISSTIGLEKERIDAAITKTVSIADVNNPFGNSLLTDADVRITKEGTGEEVVLNYDAFAEQPVLYNAEIPEGFYTAGETYTFAAEHASYPRAHVTEVFPQIVEIDDIRFEEEGGINAEGDETSKVSISFQDPPGTQFYELRVFEDTSNPSTTVLRSTYSDSIDPSVGRGALRHTNIVSDNLFDGEYKTVDLRVYRHSEDRAKERIWISLKTVTEAYYNFSKTKFARDEFGDDNPFQSPVQLYSNVTDGLGIIAFYVEDLEKY